MNGHQLWYCWWLNSGLTVWYSVTLFQGGLHTTSSRISVIGNYMDRVMLVHCNFHSCIMLHVLLQCTRRVSPWGWSWSCNKWKVTVCQKEVTSQFQSFTTTGTFGFRNLYNSESYSIDLILCDRLPRWLPLPFRLYMLQWHSDHSGWPHSLGVL